MTDNPLRRNCLVCERRFDRAPGTRQVLCSDECRARRHRDSHRAERGSTPAAACSECQGPMPVQTKGRLRLTCSPRCATARRARREREKRDRDPKYAARVRAMYKRSRDRRKQRGG